MTTTEMSIGQRRTRTANGARIVLTRLERTYRVSIGHDGNPLSFIEIPELSRSFYDADEATGYAERARKHFRSGWTIQQTLDALTAFTQPVEEATVEPVEAIDTAIEQRIRTGRTNGLERLYAARALLTPADQLIAHHRLARQIAADMADADVDANYRAALEAA